LSAEKMRLTKFTVEFFYAKNLQKKIPLLSEHPQNQRFDETVVLFQSEHCAAAFFFVF